MMMVGGGGGGGIVAGEHGGSDRDHARLLVVGDSRVGKTSLVNVLCGEYNRLDRAATRRKIQREPVAPTVGCHINVRLHSGPRGGRIGAAVAAPGISAAAFFPRTAAAAAANSGATMRGGVGGSGCVGGLGVGNGSGVGTIEMIDVGGARQYALTRPVFYDQLHGILLVHDVSNPKSLYSLREWIREITIADQKKIRYGGISARHQLGDAGGAGVPHDYYSSDDAGAGGSFSSSSSSSSTASTVTPTRRRKTAAELDEAQVSMLQRIPVMVVGNKLDRLSAKEQRYCAGPQYQRHVLTTVFSAALPEGTVTTACCSAHCAAEDATTYRDSGGVLGRVLRFLDVVVGHSSSSEGV